MVVKAVRGRRRYVVFTVPESTNRNNVESVLESLRSYMPEVKTITSFGGKAVIRCAPNEIADVSKTMVKSFPESESLITSGTLRKIRDVYPELKVEKKRHSH